MLKDFLDIVLLLESCFTNINLHERNNIIKSLIHNQLSSPRYHKLFKYSWFKSGYTNERSEKFENPVEFSFDKNSTMCDIEDYTAVRCSCCKKSICLKYFFIEYHYCNEYIMNKRYKISIYCI